MKIIKNGLDFSECIAEMENAYQKFLTNGPDVVNKKLTYLETTRKICNQLAQAFIKEENKKKDKLQEKSSTYEKTLQSELDRMRQQMEEDSGKYKEEYEKFDIQKIELEKKIEDLETLSSHLKEQKEQEEKNLEKDLQFKKKELDQTKKTLEEKLEEMTKNHDAVSKKLLIR